MSATDQTNIDLLSVTILPDCSVAIQISTWVGGILLVIALAYLAYVIWRWHRGGSSWENFELDQAEIGIGTGKLQFKPNMTDRQVAYAIWIELNTRKIGLPIDLDHDVIAEIYNSWHEFFRVTRELVKSIPVNKVRQKSTQSIITLSIEVLNEGLRPHLTKWQARFRWWYENQLKKENDDPSIDPQTIQQKFPGYDDLKLDMEKVNQQLIAYRDAMRRLAMTD